MLMGKGRVFAVAGRDWRVMLVLFAFAFVLRYYFMAAGLLHTDSVIEARAAEDFYRDYRLRYLQGLGYPGESVVMTAGYGLFRLFGSDSADYSTRFISVLFGALCVPMLYLFVRRVSGHETAGAYAGLILSFLPVHLSLSTFGKGHGIELFFLLLSAYLAVEAGAKRTLKLKVLAGLCMGFTVAVRQTSALFIPAYILLYYLESGPPFRLARSGENLALKVRERPSAVASDLAVLVLLPPAVFVLAYVPLMYYDPGYSLLGAIRSFSQEADAGFSPWSPLVKLSLEYSTKSLSELGWLLALAGAVAAWRSNRRLATALLVWFAVMFIYLSNVAMLSPRFVIPALAVPVILAAYAADWAGGRWGQPAALAIVLILLATMVWRSDIYPVLEYRRQHCGPCDFSRMLGNITSPDSVIIAMDESVHYEYYAKRAATGHPSGNDILDSGKVEASLAYLEALLRNGSDVYATTQGLGYDIPVGALASIIGYGDDGRLFNRQNGRIYSNVRYDPGRGAMVDAADGGQLPVTGLFGLELNDRFRVIPVGMMENEDWHHSDLEPAVYKAFVFNVTLRKPELAGAP